MMYLVQPILELIGVALFSDYRMGENFKGGVLWENYCFLKKILCWTKKVS